MKENQKGTIPGSAASVFLDLKLSIKCPETSKRCTVHKVRGSNETEFMVQLGLKVVDSVQVERGGDVMDVDPRGTARTCKAKVRLPRVSAVGWFLVANGPLKMSFI